MTPELKMAAEHECARVVSSFYSALDANRHDDLAALFARDGRWNRLGKIVTGPEEIKAALKARNSSWVTVHLVTNLLVHVDTQDSARSEQYVLVYRFEQSPDRPAPFPVSAPIGLSMHYDTLVKAADGWKIQEKNTRPIMIDRDKVKIHRS